jgi:hypothetical protein
MALSSWRQAKTMSRGTNEVKIIIIIIQVPGAGDESSHMLAGAPALGAQHLVVMAAAAAPTLGPFPALTTAHT